MTTEDATSVDEDTERDEYTLDEILALSDYSGLTNNEVNMLIAYKENIAYLSGQADAANSYNAKISDELLERNQKAQETAEAAFNAAIESSVKFQMLTFD